MPTLEFTVNAAQQVIQGTVTASRGDAEEGPSSSGARWERQCATCRQEVLLASDYLIINPEDISDWCGNRPAGKCQDCSGLPAPGFKAAVEGAEGKGQGACGAEGPRPEHGLEHP